MYRWPLCIGGLFECGCYIQVVFMNKVFMGMWSMYRWPLSKGGLYVNVVFMNRWLLSKGGLCVNVAYVQVAFM